ncbi:hypothetical protein OROGR_029052 [Orobanche gracilis]
MWGYNDGISACWCQLSSREKFQGGCAQMSFLDDRSFSRLWLTLLLLILSSSLGSNKRDFAPFTNLFDVFICFMQPLFDMFGYGTYFIYATSSGSFYNTETESSLGVDTMVLFQLVMEMDNTSIDIMYHTGHQAIRSFLLSGLNLSHPLTDQQLASGSSLGQSFQQAEDALTRNGKTSADFNPMCY